jgi:hypothetical protein
MGAWLPLAVFGLVFGALMILLARYQSRKYQDYLASHVAVNEKMRENQEKIIEQQAQTLQLTERQAAALDRIATALEQRKS